MRLIVSFALRLVLIVAAALFAGANGSPVVVDLLFVQFETSLVVALFVAFGVGFALSSILYLPAWLAGSAEKVQLKRLVEAQSQELDKVRKSALSEQE